MTVREIGWVFVPKSTASWIVAVLMTLVCVQAFVAVDRHSHSASDTLYGVVPYWAVTFLMWNWIGSRARKTQA